MGMLYWGYRRVGLFSVGTRHIANDVKGIGECLLQHHYVPDLSCSKRGSCLRQLHLCTLGAGQR